ncbi:nuclear transport factor 2 family protein [bacterium]|nr:nuclear transport factor 2 family protein [bacterium]
MKKILAFVLFLSINVTAQSDLDAVVKGYFIARAATMQENSSEKDVDKVLSMYTDDFVYEHPKFNAKITGKDKSGMVKWLGATRNVQFDIRQSITGFNMVAVEVELNGEMKSDGKWIPLKRAQIMFFEFDGKLIRRIVEDWKK